MIQPDVPLVMGVLNVTPDSFSDGGRFAYVTSALAHAEEMLAEGADIIDVGGESTRPGATRPVVAEELDRVIPVIAELAASGVAVSVDTMRAEVAQAAICAGAVIVNDVSGGLADPKILGVVARAGVRYVAMHWRGHSDRMQSLANYGESGGVVATVVNELTGRLEAIEAAGVDLADVVLDPGLGFAKTATHNWQLLAGLDDLASLGRPLLVDASRKAFLGAVLAQDGVPRPVDDRESAHLAVVTMLAERGVWGLRVHDVRRTSDALAAWRAWTSTPPYRQEDT